MTSVEWAAWNAGETCSADAAKRIPEIIADLEACEQGKQTDNEVRANERAKVLAELRRYLQHEHGCGHVFDHGTQTGEVIIDCTCGLDAILAEHGTAENK